MVRDGLNVGKDPAESISDDNPGTSALHLHRRANKEAIVDVSGEPFIDLEKEALAMMARE